MDPSVLGIPWKRQLYHKWKSLRNVPLRRQWFVGYDLEGNSYWELIDRNNPYRLRRKVSFERPYYHFGDFKPHPMWMQWLQYTRPTPPTLADLVNDMKRQHRLKVLAQRANEKWKSVPLKSASNDTSDPRIDSAWTGQKPVAAAEDPDASAAPLPEHASSEHASSERTPAEQAELSEHDRMVRDAMRQAEEKIRKAPKVVRDPYGAKTASSKQPASPGPAEKLTASRDEPETASFKPRDRD